MAVARDRPKVVKKKRPTGDTKSAADLSRGRKYVKRVQSEVKDTKGAADLSRGRTYHEKQAAKVVEGRHQSVPKAEKDSLEKIRLVRKKATPGHIVGLERQRYTYGERHPKYQGSVEQKLDQAAAKSKRENAGIDAPVLKVLEQTTRPLHAIAGAEKAAIDSVKAGSLDLNKVTKAAGRGLANKDKTTYSDVLKSAGVKNKTVRAVVGTTLDVAADPLTYATFGAGSVAKKAAMDAGRKAEKKAASLGLDEGQARKFGERASRAAEKKGSQRRGLVVKVGGKEVPGVRRATAKVVPAKVASKVGGVRGVATLKHVAADVNPGAVPEGVSKAEARTVRAATRTARARTSRGRAQSQDRALAIRDQVGEKNYAKIIDAIEAGNLRSLPDDLRRVAVEVRAQFRHADRLRRQAGIRGGTIGRSRRVKVPEVTADVKQSAKDLAKAQRARVAAEKAHKGVLRGEGVAVGRAEVLSRSVGGAKAERAVRRGKYAGGGQGVADANRAVQESAARVTGARRAAAEAEAAHEATKLQARAQRSARRKAITRAEERANSPRGYVPHRLTPEALEADQRAARAGIGARTVKPKSSVRRKDRRSLAQLRVDEPGRYSDDLPTLTAERMTEAHASAARAELNRELARTGRPVPRGDVDVKSVLADGEAVYHVKGSNIREVTDKQELRRIAKPTRVAKKGDKLKASGQAKQGGRFVILNKQMVDRALEGVTANMTGPGVVHGFDKATSAWKRLALATPGFHTRNLVGDTNNAYLGQAGYRLPGNLRRAAKVLKATGRREDAARRLSHAVDGADTLSTKAYGKVTYDEVARQLEKHGAFRSGYVARELDELSRSGEKAVKVRKPRTPRKIRRLGLNREDLPRLATAVEALRKGATWKEAAERVNELHFDYGDLTQFERNVARRFLPFYTWSARNIPLQARKILTHPGKYANYQKLREEAAKAGGFGEADKQTREIYAQLKQAGAKLPAGWERYISTWERRNAGIPVSIGGHKFTVSMGLPLQDLNELPGSLSPAQQLHEWYQKGMGLLNPLGKAPLEYFSNYNFFFEDQLQNDRSPNVVAPSYVGKFPDKLKKSMGVVKILDKKTGKMVWGWPAKADYLAHVLPGAPMYAQQFLTPKAGKSMGSKALGFAGVKSVPVDPVSTAMSLAYDRIAELDEAISSLRQRGIDKDNPTREWLRATEQMKIARGIAEHAQAIKGYKTATKAGGVDWRKVAGGQGIDWRKAAKGSGVDWRKVAKGGG